MSKIRNPEQSEWLTISSNRIPVYAAIRNYVTDRIEFVYGVIVSLPYLVDYVVFESEGNKTEVSKDNIFIDDNQKFRDLFNSSKYFR